MGKKIDDKYYNVLKGKKNEDYNNFVMGKKSDQDYQSYFMGKRPQDYHSFVMGKMSMSPCHLLLNISKAAFVYVRPARISLYGKDYRDKT